MALVSGGKKIALVTGSGRGIGRTIALALAKEGHAVVVNSFNPEHSERVAEEIRVRGQPAFAVVGGCIINVSSVHQVISNRCSPTTRRRRGVSRCSPRPWRSNGREGEPG